MVACRRQPARGRARQLSTAQDTETIVGVCSLRQCAVRARPAREEVEHGREASTLLYAGSAKATGPYAVQQLVGYRGVAKLRRHIALPIGWCLSGEEAALDRYGLVNKGIASAKRPTCRATGCCSASDKLASAQPLFRAHLLMEQLRDVFHYSGGYAPVQLQGFVTMATRSGLAPFIKLASRIRSHQVGIDAALIHGLSNARVESANNKLRLLTRLAFGFHSPAPLISLAIVKLDGLCPLCRGVGDPRFC